MDNIPEPMLDIEGKLLSDLDGTFKIEVIDKLNFYQIEIKRLIDSGLSPDEFNKYNALNNAILSASKVIEIAWNNLHNNK
jgi:hypothetical protein